MSRSFLYLLTGVSVLALSGCDQPQGSPDGKLTDKEKQSFALAQSLVSNGNVEEARNVYEELSRHPEATVQADLALATLDRKTGHAEDAVEVMREAQKLEPGNSAILNQLGFALIAAGHPEEAVNVFDELIAMEPDNANMYNAKAVAFDKAGNHAAAQEIYEKALKLAPSSLVVRNNLAMSYILNDQANDAINLLEPLAKQPGSSPTVRQNLALAYGIKGDKQRAMQLNMQDMPADQAKENLRFYEKYAQAQREHASTNLKDRMQPVIQDTDSMNMLPESRPEAVKGKTKIATHAKAIVLPDAEPVDDVSEAPVEATATPTAPADDNNTFHSMFGNDAVYDYPGVRH